MKRRKRKKSPGFFRLNLNTVARAVAILEGKKIEVNIAQIKEIINRTLKVVTVASGSAVVIWDGKSKCPDVWNHGCPAVWHPQKRMISLPLAR